MSDGDDIFRTTISSWVASIASH